MSDIKRFATLSLVVLSATGVSAAESQSSQKRPNVIVILTDDQGYGDIGVHGNSVIETPNLNRLHNESVRFTNFHVDPTSAPTRSALMTGCYSHRVGVWHTIMGGNHLRQGETTMSEVFKHNGYQTAIFGKWHLGANYPYRPIDRGFDEWLGLGDGGTGTTDDYFWNDRVSDYMWHNGERVYREGATHDVLFGETMNYLKQHKDDDEPMFVFLPTYVAHGPIMNPKPEIYKKYPKLKSWVAEFLVTVEEIDDKIGELDEFLHSEGLAENTIVIFMTDNGGTLGCGIFNGGMTGGKGQLTDGGHRVPCFVRMPGGEMGAPRGIDALTAHIDILPTFVDLLNLEMPREVDFDGRSLMPLARGEEWKDRTLVVETQRTLEPSPDLSTVMTQRWRLVNRKKLYDILIDPAQKRDVAAEYPEVVAQLLGDFDEYWHRVSPDDRAPAVPIVGTNFDEEIFLSTSEYRESSGYNHFMIAQGERLDGSWMIEVAEAGRYDFEIRRWPKEAAAPFAGVPEVTKSIDSYNVKGGVEVGVYMQKVSDLKAIPVSSVSLEIGDKIKMSQSVKAADESVKFTVKLPKGVTRVESTLFDNSGEKLSNAYYVYIRKK